MRTDPRRVPLSAQQVHALDAALAFMADEFARVGYVQEDQDPVAMRARFDAWARTRRAVQDTRRRARPVLRFAGEHPSCDALTTGGARCGRPAGHAGAHEWVVYTQEPTP